MGNIHTVAPMPEHEAQPHKEAERGVVHSNEHIPQAHYQRQWQRAGVRREEPLWSVELWWEGRILGEA